MDGLIHLNKNPYKTARETKMLAEDEPSTVRIEPVGDIVQVQVALPVVIPVAIEDRQTENAVGVLCRSCQKYAKYHPNHCPLNIPIFMNQYGIPILRRGSPDCI